MATTTFSTAGSFLWTCPAGVTTVQAECWGSGAGGQWASGPGGGGGEYAKETSVAVTAGNNYTVVVGAAGAGGTSSSGSGKAGATSKFVGNSVTVLAHGAGTNSTSPSPGGTGSTNTTHFHGSGCTDSGGTSLGGGGGGGSGGTAANGNTGSAHSGTTGGAGATAVTGGGAGGHGGNGGTSSTVGTAGSTPGGGGGSGGSTAGNGSNGGAGAVGKVLLTYTAANTSTASMKLSGMSMHALQTAGNTTTASLGLNLGLAATVFQGVPFPRGILGITVELLLNGTWTDISGYVQQRADIAIGVGRPNEAAQINPVTMTMTLDNRDGSFSPLNSAGQFYPYIGRNVQVRVSVAAESADGTSYTGYRFWGEVSSWPPSWDPSGSDVYVNIEAGGPLRRYVQGSLIGSPLKRFYLLKTDVTAPIALWTCEDQNGASQFTSALASGSPMTWSGQPTLASDSSFQGTDPLPLISLSTWTGSTGSYSAVGPATFTVPGTYSWTAPGGVSSLTTAECWGGGGGGMNGYVNNSQSGGSGGGGEYAKEATVAVTPGLSYPVVVGAGGAGGPLSGDDSHASNGTAGGASSFTGDAVTVTASGGGAGAYIAFPAGRGAGGTGSTNATHHDGGHGGQNNNGGFFGGSGGGGSGGSGAAGNNGTDGGTSNTGAAGGVAVTAGGAGGKGGNGGAHVDQGGTAGSVPGGGGGGGGQNSSNFAAHSGGAGGSGQVALNYSSSTTPNNVVLRFLLDVPAASEPPNNSILMRAVVASGALTKVECYYGTGGKLGFRGYNGVTLKFDSTASAFSANGHQLMVSCELATSGSAIAWSIDAIRPGSSLTVGAVTGSLAASTIGAVSQVVIAPNGDVNDTCIGFIVLQYALEQLADVSDSMNGHDGELAADRFTRLCAEEGLGAELNGNDTDTPQMGPQTDMGFTAVLQQIEDTDQGQVFESVDQFGLGYRTRVSMQAQASAFTLDYAAAMLADVPLPVYDDQLTRNDVTISRINGGSVNAQLTTGALSVSPPPDGVGDYSYSLSANLFSDTQLPVMADWVLTKGTVDVYRYPQVTVDLARTQVKSLFSAVPSLSIGDFFRISNPPAWLPSGAISLLQWGRAETLNAYRWTFRFNCVPELPYDADGQPEW